MNTVFLCYERIDVAPEYGSSKSVLEMVASTADKAQTWLRSHIPGLAAWTITSREIHPRSKSSGALTISTVSLMLPGRIEEPYTLWEAKCFGKVHRTSRDEDTLHEYLETLFNPASDLHSWGDWRIEEVDLDVIRDT